MTLNSYRGGKHFDKGKFKLLVDKRLSRVIAIWKDINSFQVFITTVTMGVDEVTRNKGRYLITVRFPKYIITYQQHMGLDYH